jgi:hypothetical protein
MLAAELIEHIEAARRIEESLRSRGVLVLYVDGEPPRLLIRGSRGSKLTKKDSAQLLAHIAGFAWLAQQVGRS